MSDEIKSLVLMPRTIDECASLAERFSKSSLIPEKLRDKPADVFVTIAYGMEFGLGPMAALKGIHVVDGKPGLSADLMVGLCLARGKAKYFKRVEATNTSVTYETLRVGDDQPRRATWTMEDAKRGALHMKDNWRCYPRSMLAARAKADLARDVYPDLLSGCYTPDELGASDVIEAEFTEIKEPLDPQASHAEYTEWEHSKQPEQLVAQTDPVLAETMATIDAAPDLAALEALAPTLTHLSNATDATKAKVRDYYKARRAKLKQNGVKTEASAS